MSGKLAITLVRSLIGRPKDQRLVIEGLGLRKREQTVILPDNPSTRGAAFKVRHLLHVEEAIDTGSDEGNITAVVAEAPIEAAATEAPAEQAAE